MKRIYLANVVAIATLGTPAYADLSDPTRPYDGRAASYVAPAPLGPMLQSTRISAQRKSAVISGRTVSVGDVVDGAIVADIRQYEVVLNKGGRETILRLLPKLTKEKGNAE